MGDALYSVRTLCCAKRAEPIEMPFWMLRGEQLRKHVLDGGTHWRHLAYTIKPEAMRTFCQLVIFVIIITDFTAVQVHRQFLGTVVDVVQMVCACVCELCAVGHKLAVISHHLST